MEDSERFLRDVGERRRRGGGDVFTIHYPRNNTLLGKSRLLCCRWHTHFSLQVAAEAGHRTLCQKSRVLRVHQTGQVNDTARAMSGWGQSWTRVNVL
jgi:hypothetical protein